MRMHKTRLLALLFLLCIVGMAHAETTADKVTISELTLAPGGEQGYFTVSLEGITTYTAYQMDIYLPDGVEIASDANGQKMLYMANDIYSLDGNDIYPFTATTNPFTGAVTGKTYTHGFQFAAQADGAMRVECHSSASEALTQTSGALFHVFVKASAFAKPELNDITLGTIRFSTPEAVLHRFDDTNIEDVLTVAGECSLSLNITEANKYGTCVSPFGITLPEGVEAYSCYSCSDDALLLTPAEAIEAYTPYIIYAPNGYSGTFSGTPAEEDYTARVTEGKSTNGWLTAALKQTELTADESGNTYYVLQRKADTSAPMFYRVGTTSYILPAGKCYLTIPSAVSTMVTFRLDNAKGLPNVVMDKPEEDGPIYNLQGQQILHPQSGEIYIQNGRKFIQEKK